MLRRLRSGRFWIKTLILGGATVVVVWLALQMLLIGLLRPDAIQNRLDNTLAGSGFSAHFNNNINRGWLPSPHFVLHRVSLTQGGQSVLESDEAHIALSWLTLLGKPKIKRISFDNAELNLSRDSSGRWNIEALTRLPGVSAATINAWRLRDSTITLHDDFAHQRLTLTHLNADLDGLTRHRGQYRLKSVAELGATNHLNIDTKGGWREDSGTLFLDDSAWTLTGKWPNIGEFSLDTHANLNYSRRTDTGLLSNLRAKIALPAHKGNFSLSGAPWQWHAGTLKAAALEGVGNWQHEGSNYNLTFNINKLHLDHTQWTAVEAKIQLDEKDPTGQFTLSLNGAPVYTLAGGQWRLSEARLLTRRTPAQGSVTTWQTDLRGGASGTGLTALQMQGEGSFDAQPGKFALLYDSAISTNPRWQADINLSRLDLTRYVRALPVFPASGTQAASAPGTETAPIKRLTAWLDALQNGSAKGSLNIGSLITPYGTLDNVSSTWAASRLRLSIQPFTAELYEGHTEAKFFLGNAQTPLLTLDMQLRGTNLLPFFSDLLGVRSLSGRADADLQLKAAGDNLPALLQSLDGEVSMDVQNGSINGFDLHRLAQSRPEAASAPSPIAADAAIKTSFTRLHTISQWISGVGYIHDFNISSPSLSIIGTGTTNFAQNHVDYTLSVQEDGSSTLPLRVTGALNNPKLALDYHSLTQDSTSPQEKQKAIEEALQKQWQLLKQAAPPAPRTASTPL